MRRSVNLSTFLRRSLKAERCDLGGNRSGAGALSKQDAMTAYIWAWLNYACVKFVM